MYNLATQMICFQSPQIFLAEKVQLISLAILHTKNLSAMVDWSYSSRE